MGEYLVDLEPWIDYFKMLSRFEKEGFLEIKQDKHEAFVTQPALHAMSEGDVPTEQIKKAIPDTMRRIRAYAAYKSKQGEFYLKKAFALHVVKDEAPHDVIYTMVLSVRSKPLPWQKKEKIEIINYHG